MADPLPTSLPAFQRAFSDEAACRAYLAGLRSGENFRCPSCGGTRAWVVRTRGLLTCAGCRRQISATSGTALDRLRLPLSLVFLAAFQVATTPGLNAVTLARQLGINRHATAWLLLAKLRRAMTTALTEPLSGVIEADEAWYGGPQDREKRRKYGRSSLMVLALAEARSEGRCRLVVVGDNSGPTLLAAIAANVAPGSTIQTDGWRSYNGLARAGYTHVRKPHTPGWAKRGDRSTPYADEIISASKRWLLATYQKQPREHLPAYLAEFAFRREFRDPAERFAAVLRSLLAAPTRTRRHMNAAGDLPPVIGRAKDRADSALPKPVARKKTKHRAARRPDRKKTAQAV